MILSSGVWFLSESMLKDKIFHVFVGVYAVFMGLFELFLLVFPVFRLEGMVSGSVALSWYQLSYYGKPLSVASLSSVGLLVIPLYIVSFYLIFVGIYHVFVLFRGGDLVLSSELLLGGGFSLLSMSTLPLALFNVVSHEVSLLDVSFSGYTSAGFVYLGETRVYSEFISRFFSGVLIFNVLVFVVVTIVAYFNLSKEK